jgi:hypothetical protein
VAVSTGTKRLIGTFTVGSPTTFGQGPYIRYEVLMSFDDSSVSIPTWTYVTQWLRAFSTSRGRASELADVDAGTANLTLDNRDRRFDPTYTAGPYYPNLRPMNRVWIRMQFNGVTHDVFKGYVESYEQQYPESGLDAVTVVRAVDEFKVLALRNLPTTDPPRESYADVVAFDNPSAYWRMSDGGPQNAAVGPSLNVQSSTFGGVGDLAGAIVGDRPDPFCAFAFNSSEALGTGTLQVGEGPDLSYATDFAVELWFKTDGYPAGDFDYLLNGQGWTLWMETSGVLTFKFTDTTTTVRTIATPSAVTKSAWHHLVITAVGATWSFWLDGAQVTSAAYSWQFKDTGTHSFSVGDEFGEVSRFWFDEIAVYRQGLTAARVAAHYTAGVNRGFARDQLAGERIGRVLDSIGSQAPRNLRAGARPLAGQYAGNGPSTLETLRDVENAEAVDAVLFVAGDGTVTFLDGGHRAVSPWDTVQIICGDGGGTELDYMDIQLDFSDAFVTNRWDVTREGGTTQTASDATSISRYLTRPQSLAGLKLRDDADALDVAGDMLAKYKEPLVRVLSITPKTMNVDVVDAVFQLEIGDRIQVRLTPPGGGTRFDQVLFVQSIGIDAVPEAIFPTVRLGVSPV